MTEFSQKLCGEKLYVEEDWNNLLDHGLAKCASYIMRVKDGIVEAINGKTGKISYSNADNGVVSNAVITELKVMGGGLIFYTRGTYPTKTAIRIRSYICLEGEGWGETNAATTLDGSTCTESVILFDYTAEEDRLLHASVRNMRILAGAKSGIDVGDCDRFTVDEVMVLGGEYGVRITGAIIIASHLNRVYAYGATKNALFLSGADNYVTDCDFGGNVLGRAFTEEAIYLYWCHKSRFVNVCGWAGKKGININQSHNNVFVGCRFDLNWDEGMWIQSSYYTVVSACSIITNSLNESGISDGIVLIGSDGFPCNYNVISGCHVGQGMWASPEHRWAIHEADYADYNNIIGNTVESLFGQKIVATGAHSRIINNLGYMLGYQSATPINASGQIVDYGGTNPIATATEYTNIHSPKTIYVSGGTVQEVKVDDTVVFTVTNVMVYLMPGQTFQITFTVEPTIKVLAL